MVKTLSTKTQVGILNTEEPFTSAEFHRYNRNVRYFIRGIQLVDDCTKDAAIKTYKKYQTEMPKRQRRIYADSVHKALHDDSAGKRTKKGKHGKHLPTKKPPVVKLTKEEEHYPSEEGKPKFSNRYTSFTDWFTNTNSSSEVKQRALSAHQKYPNDTLNQLTHGHKAGA